MRFTNKLIGLIVALFIMVPTGVYAQVSVSKTITDELDISWGMAFVSPTQLIVTQRSGDVVLVNTDSGKITKVTGAPEVLSRGQGGLLDVKTSPDYQRDGWLYFTYVKPTTKRGVTALARAKLNGVKLTDWQDLLVTKSQTSTSRHFGSRIAFDNDGHVFFSVGDRGERELAQDLSNHAGTIIRLNLDGSVPKDNPFVNKENALGEIYSYGHRNPQGLTFDNNTQQLWAIEHGPRGGDELNLIKPGANYGWPIVSHGREYVSFLAVGEATQKAGYEDPVQVYIPSIAPSSLLLLPDSKGATQQFYIGALKLTHLNQVTVRDNKAVGEQRHLEKLSKRIRNVIADGAGHLIIATDDGQLIRVTIAF